MKTRILISVFALLACVSCGTSYKAGDANQDEYVDVGYGKVRKSQNAAAVSKVNMADSMKDAIYTSIFEYIEGHVAGVDVNGTSITVRGENSFGSSSAPLMYVDGVETKDISDINPNDVDTIEVLKDGASTAAYGSRGSNGVILITLKRQ